MPKRSMLALVAAAALVALAASTWLLRSDAKPDPGTRAEAPTSARPTADTSRYPILIPGGDEVSAGHVLFRLVGARLDRHREAEGGRPETLGLRVSLRATELSGLDTRVGAENVRLLASGRQFGPQSSFEEPLYASQSVDLNDILFLVPAPLETASLQLGAANGPTALLVLPLRR